MRLTRSAATLHMGPQHLLDAQLPCREACTEFAQGDEWTECPALQDSCTVNIGDALMRWTDDKLKSNYHRVR